MYWRYYSLYIWAVLKFIDINSPQHLLLAQKEKAEKPCIDARHFLGRDCTDQYLLGLHAGLHYTRTTIV
jgi:hypothetical protein